LGGKIPHQSKAQTLSCRQLIEQSLGFFQIERVETLGEPAEDGSEKNMAI